MTTKSESESRYSPACPPADIIRKAKFANITKSTIITDALIMLSDDFNFQGNDWNVLYEFSKNKKIGIAEGVKQFNKLKLNTPVIENENNKMACIYIEFSDEGMVVAASPPDHQSH